MGGKAGFGVKVESKFSFSRNSQYTHKIIKYRIRKLNGFYQNLPRKPSRTEGPEGITKARKEIRPGGFEPPALGSEDRCSIQLSYGRMVGIGRSDGNRTRNNWDHNPALSL